MEFLEPSTKKLENVGSSDSLKNSRKIGLVLGGIAGGTAVLLSAICLPFVTPAFRKICLPYVPATPAQINNVFKALSGRSGSLIDLGSGDGRIVLQAARSGFKAEGIELNPWLVMYSRLKALTSSSTASFSREDIWKTNVGNYDNIVIFGVDTMMQDLKAKCQNEIKPGAVVVACRFPFPDLEAQRVIGRGIDKVWLYSKSSMR